jgi:outer membrane protein OmpA-like peptidoglycan-associated protein
MKSVFALAFCAAVACAQTPNPTQNIPQSERAPQTQGGQSMPLYRITVVRRSTPAVNYRHRSSSTKVDFRGTELMPQAKGEARVQSKQGRIDIDAKFADLTAASRFGPEYLTYVLWAITPEGRASNLGEVLLDADNKSKLDVSTDNQAFGLIVTAEPYFSVTTPSDVVVMENFIRADTVGKIETVDASYELLRRGQYTLNAAPGQFRPVMVDKRVPLELFEARNAVQIARWTGADRYASDTYKKAENLLAQAEAYQSRKAGQKPVAMTAREAAQTAEDSRLIAIRRQDEERLAQERQAAAEREAKARADADAAAQQQRLEAERRVQAEAERTRAEAEKARAEAERLTAEASRKQAELAKAQAEAAAQQAERIRAEAEAARQSALADADRARQQAQEADRMRQRAESDREALRQQLLQQLNMVLETRETARGLIVNMSDVLFDTGKYTLKPGAREKLARVAGIVLAHPGLTLEVEGHTDNVGGDAYNQRLSEQRADTVREYLVQNGVRSNNITARGFGKTQPVASNETTAGRQQNRRVELVVSGDIIGTQLRGTINGTQQPAPVPPPR